MAAFTVTGSQIGCYAKQLAASTVDTVTVSGVVDTVEVWSDGTSALYFTADGSTPTVGGAGTYEVPAGASAVRDGVGAKPVAGGVSVVSLISAGTPHYSVTVPSRRV